MEYREIRPEDDAALAALIRKSLEANRLDIPGTAYFDETLDHLSDHYLGDPAKRFYYIAEDDGEVAGGIGLDKADLFDECAELQKLYLADRVKGCGYGYRLIELIEDKARELGYRRMYLETHTNLEAAIRLYEKCGYYLIEKPEAIVHSSMNRFFLKEL